MPTKKDLTKEERIKQEYNRLRRIFSKLDKNMKTTVDSLLRNAAFMAVSLDELQEAQFYEAGGAPLGLYCSAVGPYYLRQQFEHGAV